MFRQLFPADQLPAVRKKDVDLIAHQPLDLLFGTKWITHPSPHGRNYKGKPFGETQPSFS